MTLSNSQIQRLLCVAFVTSVWYGGMRIGIPVGMGMGPKSLNNCEWLAAAFLGVHALDRSDNTDSFDVKGKQCF